MTVADLLEALRDSQPRTSVELQAELGVSQAVVSRLVTRAGSRILRLGAGRSTRYAMAVDVFGVHPDVSLFEVGNTGIVEEIGSLRQSAAGAYIVAGDDLPFWTLGANGNGVFGGLPYERDGNLLIWKRLLAFSTPFTRRRPIPRNAAPRWITEHEISVVRKRCALLKEIDPMDVAS